MSMIEALQKAEAYPHPVGEVSLAETHISWVFLSGDYAYKVKKPMDFGFLDFSTLAQRKHFCEEELRLNRRFAPQLYLDVVPVTREGDSFAFAGAGEAVDYAVRMTQFDSESLLDRKAAAGELQASGIRKIGRAIADFHAALAKEPAPDSGITPRPGSPEAAWAPAQQNFEQVEPLLARAEDLQKLDAIRQWSEQSFAGLEAFMRQRLENGFVRECHGDLHLGNMVQIDGEVVFFDCIEFNPSFRQIDVACELAFTVMDLEARGMADHASLLLNTYLEESGDYDGLRVLNFYKVYFALVRAKVTLFQAHGVPAEELAQHAVYPEFLKYLNLALGYTRGESPFVAMMHGVSGSGKSTVAEAIAGASGAIRVRSDVERKRLYGLAPGDSSNKDIYSREATIRTFDRLAELVQVITSAGFSCIVDATFLHREVRDRFVTLATELGCRARILDCRLDEETLVRRLDARTERGDDVSEATVEIMRLQQGDRDALAAVELAYTTEIDASDYLSGDQLDAVLESLGHTNT
ncbi:AAA family ATPase [Biformimicrobium ophioploci]|uniref:Bifunctional aminoglycoside phosphotransferase/ATP-binding protein n=1 Tax=Biformimicrobium ophioploci TaxID=3036711 RepID=A0ABQ6LXN3_9GAMM|nr:bifunctional aminoglycoside phosphotransferase/ATP-binding protein [Microbulbifer sp. NKW57]GMG86874.1 bifunctional aminoglycoside phosphotransferase/ATP-binding protein [Microbulbifer sp. NKW57]